jgi:recombination protein RecT
MTQNMRQGASSATREAKTKAVQIFNQVKSGLTKLDITSMIPLNDMDKKRLVQCVLNAVRTTPALQNCVPMSIVMAAADALTLGLECNTPLDEGYLIPFGSQRDTRKKPRCVFVSGYRGLIKLAKQDPSDPIISGHVVRDNDDFWFNEATREIRHSYDIKKKNKERGRPIAFYSIAQYPDGRIDFEIMSKEDVDEIRQKSQGRDSFGWVEHYERMGCKTAIRRHCGRLPKRSRAMAAALELDRRADKGDPAHISDLFGDVGVGPVIDIPGDEGTGSQDHPEDRKAPTVDQGKAKKSAPKQKPKPAPEPEPAPDPPEEPPEPPPQGLRREPGDDTEEIEEEPEQPAGNGSALTAPDGVDMENWQPGE